MCSTDESPPAYSHSSNTPCVRSRRLESTIRAVMLSVVHFPLSGIQKCWCGTIATMLSQASGRDSQGLRCFSLVLATSRLRRQLHVVGSVKHERPSLQQMAKWRNLPGVVHQGLHVVVPRVPSFYEGLLSFFFVLPTRLSAQCLLSSWPDTASIRSCLLLPPGFFDTREAGVRAGSRACFFTF